MTDVENLSQNRAAWHEGRLPCLASDDRRHDGRLLSLASSPCVRLLAAVMGRSIVAAHGGAGARLIEA
jgi:hypothetical protein